LEESAGPPGSAEAPPGDDTTSLQHTAELINPFLVDSGFTETEAPLDGLFDASFTQDWVDRAGD